MIADRICIRLLAVMLALLLPCLALAEALDTVSDGVEGPFVDEQGLLLGASSILYPQLAWLPDEAIQDAVNARIAEVGQIDALLARLPMVMSGPVPLTVSYECALHGGVFSCAMLASGPVTDDRSTQVWSAVTFDLETGAEIALDDLFAVPADEAREAIEDWLCWEIAPEMSAHLSNSELTPLPDVFFISAEGLTLCYPMAQLSTLSDRAGTVTIRWYELADLFDFSEGSVLDRLGASRFVTPDEDAATDLRACLSDGLLPGIPVRLGSAMQEATDTYRLLTDPDLYEGGRMFAPEDSRFRSCWLLTDALTDKTWTQSVVQGLRADRISLFGLVTAAGDVPGTVMDDWRALLGEPDSTVSVDEALADLYRLVPGTSDYYQMGDYRLRLHADEDGQLVSVFLTY